MPSANEPQANEPAAVPPQRNEEGSDDMIPFSGPVRWVIGIGLLVAYASFALYFRIPAPGPFTNVADSHTYCFNLEQKASGLSSVNAVYAMMLTLVFIGATYLAMSVTAKNEWVRRALFATTLICAPLAFFLYRRSDAAVELAAAASDALKRSADLAEAKLQAERKLQGDKQAQEDATTDGTSYRICAGAWGEWVKSRIDSNQIGRVALQEAAKTRDAELDKRLQRVESVSAKAATDGAHRMEQVEGLSSKAVDAANRVEAALAKVTLALGSKKPEDLKAARAAVDDANAAIKATPKAVPAAP
jgi:hypothetical protein